MDGHFNRMFEPSHESSQNLESKEDIIETKAVKKQKVANQDIEKLLKEADSVQIDNFDSSTLKVRLSNLEKKISKNQLLRSKYSDQPDKFLESEVALDEEISRIREILSESSLYQDFSSFDGVPTILSLLSHENSDISISILALLADITDPQNIEEEEIENLVVDILLKHSSLELLATNILRFDESNEEESKGVYYTFQILENLSDLRPSLNITICKTTKILEFLVKRLKFTTMDANKLYASELLSIYLQTSDEIQELFGNGLNPLLESIAFYRRRNPMIVEEEELIENMFNSLCGSLMVRRNQDLFRSLEGFELMLKCMKEKKYVSDCALKVIDHAVARNPRNCERLVEIGGLKTIFPYFMGRLAPRKKSSRELNEEHCIAIIAALFLFCPRESKNKVCERLLCKFLEKDMEKVDRSIELYDKYQRKVEELLPHTFSQGDYKLRLDLGLFSLQRICLIITFLCLLSDAIKKRVLKKLHELNRQCEEIEKIMKEYALMIGDVDSDNDASSQEIRDIINGLAVVFKQILQDITDKANNER